MLGQDQGASSSSPSAVLRCQDCGNQSKRGCPYARCRTCCNNRNFPCSTHVKSTWVPVIRRRQRLSPSNDETKPAKRSRDNNSIGGNLNLPAEVNIPAVFRCVRVSSVDNVVDEFAYQTSVNIAGHVFKGVLYDQGAAHNSGTTVYGGGDGGGANTPTPNLFGGSVPVTQLFQYSNVKSHD